MACWMCWRRRDWRIAFCPLAQGLLTDRYLHGIPSDSRASKPHGFLKKNDIDDHGLGQVHALNKLAGERGQTLAQMALAWVLRDGRMTSALIGASRVEQIEQNVAALANLQFSADELGQIDAILRPPEEIAQFGRLSRAERAAENLVCRFLCRFFRRRSSRWRTYGKG